MYLIRLLKMGRAKRYDFALKTLRNLGSGEDTTPGENTPLGKYLAYRSGETVPTYDRADSSKPGSIGYVAVNPFSNELDDANLIKVEFSGRAKTFLDNTDNSTIKTAVNHGAATAAMVNPRGFQPAKAFVKVYPDEPPTGTDPVSQLTGVSYKATGAVSYTLPFGQKENKLHETIVRTDIATAVTDIAALNGKVGFKSEVF